MHQRTPSDLHEPQYFAKGNKKGIYRSYTWAVMWFRRRPFAAE